MVCRGARELGGTGVDRLERGHDAKLLAASTHLKLISPGQMPDLHIGQAHAFQQAERLRIKAVERHPAKVLDVYKRQVFQDAPRTARRR